MVDQRVADLRPRDHLQRKLLIIGDHGPQQLERRLRNLRRGGVHDDVVQRSRELGAVCE